LGKCAKSIVRIINGFTGEIIMIGGLGTTELIIILVIVVVLFGVGRIGKIAGEMGSGIRAFKEGIQGDEEEDDGEKPESEAAEESQEEESKT